MQTRILSDEEFRSTFSNCMTDVTDDATSTINIWHYLESVPASELLGHRIYEPFVDKVYRNAPASFEHVLVMTRTKNVYVVVVIDLKEQTIYGHHLLDLNMKYGRPLSQPGDGQ